MTTKDEEWRFPWDDRRIEPVYDEATLRRMDISKLTDEELGRLVRYILPHVMKQCAEADAFKAYCEDYLKALGQHLTRANVYRAKAQILDRYCYVMGILPPSHFVTLLGFTYPFHLCLPDILEEVCEKINQLAARTNADVPGFPLGFQSQEPPE